MFLWIPQGVLSAMFVAAGVLRATQPRDKLISQPPWVSDVPTPAVRLIGVAEFASGLGMILPGAFAIATVLTPLAATGPAVIIVLAMGLHARRKEPQAIGFNAILLVVAAVIMWGRFGPYSF
ncbi:DoxX family protein [Streptomyces roseirectus]|uniref:DoxX family protein n=1 Tax=Streptomyces roseirectus TaxID=2768066 RepID=UPI001FE9E65B|nr:DoxX family protein [Streptomyces roseirectus]